MFADLRAADLKPSTAWENQDFLNNLPEFSLSEELRTELLEALREEEGSDVCLYDHTVVVKRGGNYIFFPNQWFFLASLCKKYAEALTTYFNYFEENIRPNNDLLRALGDDNYDSSILEDPNLDEEDRKRMIMFIRARKSDGFRDGKLLFNKNSNTWRAAKDVFGSIVLKMISVPDSSSDYLGCLIYYLAKRPGLYNKVEEEIKQQLKDIQHERTDVEKIELPSSVKEQAKKIVEYIYDIDNFEKMRELFSDTGRYLKIDTSVLDIFQNRGNLLRYMFALPNAGMYDNGERVFNDRVYNIRMGENVRECKLTGEWQGNVTDNPGGGNFVEALIEVVNRYYSEFLEITREGDRYYLCKKNSRSIKKFSIDDLPKAFDSSFARRYITSLLAKPFVILTGNSGTGKTRIAKQFAEYLEVIDSDGEKNWLIVSVGADWTDNSKVVGFYNPLAENGVGRYEKTGILKLIERANSNPDIPYFLILDEMNLSHVERYFSDFLSHMETPDNPFELDGYRTGRDGQPETGRLSYPKNLFVTGTVNIDETTYMFSSKVLDRANVIEFKPDRDSVIGVFSSPQVGTEIRSAGIETARGFMDLAEKVRNGENCIGDEMMEKASDILGSIYDILGENGFEFGYRTVNEIRQYIRAAMSVSEDDFSDDRLYQVLDEQLLQKILPKIHGNRKEIGTMLKSLEDKCNIDGGHELKISRCKIQQMEDRLAAVQYASFI